MDFNNLERKTKAELFELIQSKQAEIDELKSKIDEIVKLVHDYTPDYWLDNMIQELLK